MIIVNPRLFARPAYSGFEQMFFFNVPSVPAFTFFLTKRSESSARYMSSKAHDSIEPILFV